MITINKIFYSMLISLFSLSLNAQVSIKETHYLHKDKYVIELTGELDTNNMLLAKRLNVSIEKTGEKIQSIDVTDKHMVLRYPNPYISTRDLNFDGYSDLIIACQAQKSNYMERNYSCWIIDTTTLRLEYASYLEDYPIRNILSNKKRIETEEVINNDNVATCEYAYSAKETLLLMKETILSYLKDGSELYVTKERMNDKMQLLSERLMDDRKGTLRMTNYLNPKEPSIKVVLNAKYDYSTYRIQSISVLADDVMIQTLTGDFKSFYDSDNIYIYQLKDVNFDGYKDILIRKNRTDCKYLWLYHPEKKKFIEIEEFSKLPSTHIDYKTKEIVSEDVTLYAHCQSSTITSYYKFYDYKLEMVNQTSHHSDSDPNKKDVIETIDIEIIKPDK